MQKQINKFLVALVTAVLLGVAGCTNNPSTNNAVNNTANGNNQNVNLNGKMTPPAVCNENGDNFDQIMDKVIGNLKDSFKPGGTASYNYDSITKKLTFSGYISADGKELDNFFGRFIHFKNGNNPHCVETFIFNNGSTNTSFEWRSTSLPPANPPTPDECNTKVDDVFQKSDLKEQLDLKYFTYNYDKNSKVLLLNGYFRDDLTKRLHMRNLMQKLGKLMTDGCISKIVFGPTITKSNTSAQDKKIFMEEGFGWLTCDPLIECHGACQQTCDDIGNSNTVVNTNTNVKPNSNTATNINANAK